MGGRKEVNRSRYQEQGRWKLLSNTILVLVNIIIIIYIYQYLFAWSCYGCKAFRSDGPKSNPAFWRWMAFQEKQVISRKISHKGLRRYKSRSTTEEELKREKSS